MLLPSPGRVLVTWIERTLRSMPEELHVGSQVAVRLDRQTQRRRNGDGSVIPTRHVWHHCQHRYVWTEPCEIVFTADGIVEAVKQECRAEAEQQTDEGRERAGTKRRGLDRH